MLDAPSGAVPRIVAAPSPVITPSVPLRGLLPAEDVSQAVTTSGFNGGNAPGQGGWLIQPIIGTKQIITRPSSGTAVSATPATAGTPKQVMYLTATESPYKTSDGRMVSLVSVSFQANPSDAYFAGVQVWFTGYHGSATPQLMTNGTASPISFLCDTTKETVVVTVVAIGATGLLASFAQAPTATITLDGVISPPPAPSIAQNTVALPSSGGWQFAFNVISGLEADVIDGYWIYHSTTSAPPTAPANRFKYEKQPPTNIGTITFQEVTSSSPMYYWVSAVNTSGLESALTSATGPVASSVRPTSYSGVNLYSNPTNAYDGNESSAATGSDYQVPESGGLAQDITYSGWAPLAGAPPSVMNLKILSAATFTVSTYTISDDPTHTRYKGSGSGTATLQVSLDGGSSWITVYTFSASTFASRPSQYDNIALSLSQDLTQIRVRGTVNSEGTAVTMSQSIYEIRVEVTQ